MLTVYDSNVKECCMSSSLCPFQCKGVMQWYGWEIKDIKIRDLLSLRRSDRIMNNGVRE